ncbi:MAG TPA: hypothetical protein ACFE0H_03610 [Elainellaceae cyanobacterium]
MNSPSPSRQRLQYQQRLLALSLQEIQTTGEFDFPPFVELVHQWEELFPEPTHDLEQVSSVSFREHPAAIDSRLRVIRESVKQLQAMSALTPEDEIQKAVLALVQETRLLEMQFLQRNKGSHALSEDAQAALATLRYVRVYLLAKFSDRHFLSSRGLRTDEPSVYEAHFNRCFRYLTNLQDAANILVELLVQDIHRDFGSD